jgi:hypothetical protein
MKHADLQALPSRGTGSRRWNLGLGARRNTTFRPDGYLRGEDTIDLTTDSVLVTTTKPNVRPTYFRWR